MKRIGRWSDFKNDYKTLDPTFMESVWWVFKKLWDKGLVYRGFKVGLPAASYVRPKDLHISGSDPAAAECAVPFVSAFALSAQGLARRSCPTRQVCPHLWQILRPIRTIKTQWTQASW